MPAWYWLLSAIALEVAGTFSMKLSDGFSKTTPSILLFVFYALSFIALTFALKKIDVSIAYAIWSGVGTVAIAVLGVIVFKESMTIVKILSIVLVIVGVIGLHLSSEP